MTVFPQTKTIRRVSSAPASPNSSPMSPTSIIAIKSPVERRNSKRISDPFSFMSPFVVSFPEGTDVPPMPPIPVWAVPPKLRIPPVPTSLPPIPKDSAPDISAEVPRPALAIPKVASGKGSDPASIEVSDPSVKGGGQHRSSQVQALRIMTSSHHKRVPSTRRHETSMRRSSRRLVLKRDSGAPFSDHVATAVAPVKALLFPSSQTEGVETKETRKRGTMRWSASRRLLRIPSRRAKTTVVKMRKGKEEAEETDIEAVIPQLRELKAPKRSRW